MSWYAFDAHNGWLWLATVVLGLLFALGYFTIRREGVANLSLALSLVMAIFLVSLCVASV